MRLKVRDLNISGGSFDIVVINQDTASSLDIHASSRLRLTSGRRSVVAVVDLAEPNVLKRGEIGLFTEVYEKLKVKDGDFVNVFAVPQPESVEYIKKKLDGLELNSNEIKSIIKDIVKNHLSQVEMSAFVTACYTRRLTMDETYYLTKAIVDTGETIKFKDEVILDKHCVSEDTPLLIKDTSGLKVVRFKDLGLKYDFRKCDAETEEAKITNLKALTFDENNKLVFDDIVSIIRHKAPKKLYRIILKGNKYIDLTDYHTIFVLKKGAIRNLPVTSLRKGDYVVVPRAFSYSKKITSINLLEFGLKNGLIDKEIIYHSDGTVSLKKSGKSINLNMPINTDLMHFLGLYLAEGFTNYQGVFLNFGSHEIKLINKVIELIERLFNVTPTINKPHKTAVRICIYNRLLAKLFKHYFKFNDGATNKRIPDLIFSLPDDLKIEFLKAYAMGDGYVRRGYECVFVTNSPYIAEQLQYLLSILGMSSSISEAEERNTIFPTRTSKVNKSYYIYTQARELFGGRTGANVSFKNLIPIKESGLYKLVNEDIGWIDRRKIKNQKYLCFETARKILNKLGNKYPILKKLIDSDLSFIEIKDVVPFNYAGKYVYDLKMKKYHRFVAGKGPMLIHNCIGGISGNRTTMIVVPIIASFGVKIPKTSSRSITSPAGTADTMEILAPVELSVKKIRQVVTKANGCIVWGGNINLAAADDKLISVRHPLALDPVGLMLASIMAKKAAVGSTHVLVDIPLGAGAKIKDLGEAKFLGMQFIELGKRLGIKVKPIISDGSKPIGKGIGPVLEARDVLSVLRNEIGAPTDLYNKSLRLAAELLEFSGVVPVGEGFHIAKDILDSGRAYETMKQIIKLQGGDPDISPSALRPGKYEYALYSPKTGKIKFMNDDLVSKIARMAGAPKSKKAGVYLHKNAGDFVKRGQEVLTIYSESEDLLKNAKDVIRKDLFIIT